MGTKLAHLRSCQLLVVLVKSVLRPVAGCCSVWFELANLAMSNGNSDIENGPVEIVDLHIGNCDFPLFCVCLPEGNIKIVTMLSMGKSTISMTMFNSKLLDLLVYQRVHVWLRSPLLLRAFQWQKKHLFRFQEARNPSRLASPKKPRGEVTDLSMLCTVNDIYIYYDYI